MKRILTIIILCLLTIGILCSCNSKPGEQNSSDTTTDAQTTETPETTLPPEISVKLSEVCEANKIGAILGKYKSMIYAQIDYTDGRTNDYNYIRRDNGEMYLIAYHSSMEEYAERDLYYEIMYGEETVHLSTSTTEAVYFDGETEMLYFPDMEFKSLNKDTDSNYIGIVEYTIKEDEVEDWSTWHAKAGDVMVYQITFAADDYRILEIDYTFRHTDGTERHIAAGAYVYNAETLYMGSSVQRWLDSEDKLTVEIVLLGGEARSFKVMPGVAISFETDEGNMIVTSPDGTEGISGIEDGITENIKLYEKKKQ